MSENLDLVRSIYAAASSRSRENAPHDCGGNMQAGTCRKGKRWESYQHY